MFFTIIILSIIIYAYFIKIDEIEDNKFLKYCLPIFGVLFFTFALQYNVGTDYQSYLESAIPNDLGKFKLTQFINSGEYLFALIVYISQQFSNPQIIFFIVSLIQNTLFLFSLKEVKKINLSIFYFLIFYFTLSLCFFNQFNGIRQFISIQLIFLSCLKFINNDLKNAFILLLLSPFFHFSSIIVIIILVLVYYFYKKFIGKKIFNKKYFALAVLLFSFIYFIDFNSILLNIVRIFDIYSTYIGSSYVEKMSFTEIITKIAKLIIVFYSLYRIKINKLTDSEKKLLFLGSVSSLIMILSFSSSLIWRLYLFFDLFIIFPVLIFFKYEASNIEKKLIISYLTFILFIKIIIIPKGEYLYQNIFTK